MASVPGKPPPELFERAAKAVERSRELCDDTRRLITETRDGIAMVRETDRWLETALRERNRANARHASGTR